MECVTVGPACGSADLPRTSRSSILRQFGYYYVGVQFEYNCKYPVELQSITDQYSASNPERITGAVFSALPVFIQSPDEKHGTEKPEFHYNAAPAIYS